MAPMTRNSVNSATGNGNHAGGLDVPRNQNFREGSWQLVSQSNSRFERGFSEGPSSYDGDEMASRNGEDADYAKPPMIENNSENDDVLYPLKDAANRVGNEVERFAEFLDGYNPLKVTEGDERREMAFDLIELYHKIALETLDRLRDRHESERRKIDGLSWRRKMRGLKITQDTDEMELEDSDAEEEFVTNSKTTVKDLVRWEQEAQTWDLLKRLAHLRFSDSNTAQSPKNLGPIHQYSNERDVWEHFLETDKLALERKTVLRWLQDTAEDSGEEIDVLVQDLQQNADRGDIIAHGWLHTKAAIKNLKRVNSWARPLDPTSAEVQNAAWNTPKTEPLVTQLDPDSVTRQGRKLEAQDEYFERAIWLGCYEMLRRGRSAADIREWCMDRTEIWRAVSMSGLPDEQPQEGDEEGNPASGALWRRMCFALARNGGNDEYERAVYGILSGDISSVEPVCRTWDDFVFTHYNALLRTQFDQYIQSVHPQGLMDGTLNFSALDAIVLHGDNATAGNRLVEKLKTDARTSQETLQPMKMLQGVLIADQFAYFIHQQGLALSKFANEHTTSNLIPRSSEQPKDLDITKYIDLADHDSLRVLTHVLLIFRSLGLDFGGVLKESVIENVIVAYITFLRLANKGELIPLYCSQLSGARRYATLSRNLIDITDPEQRITQIRLMRELGLDVQQFVKFQSRFLFQDYPDETKDYPASKMFDILDDNGRGGKRVRKDFFGRDPDEVDRVDLLFIRSLEWYLLVDGLWAETFQVGRMLYQRFFKHMHLNAARCLASRVPSSDIAKSKTLALLGESLDFSLLESESDDDLTEVLDGTANNKRLIKRYMLEQAKNFRELETLVMALDHIETISTTFQILEEIDDQKWQSELKRGAAQAIVPAKACLPGLFQGWLTTSQSAEPEFKILRETYLPQTILGWVSQLEMAGILLTRDFLMEAMDLATIIAAEDSDLLELFTSTGRMPELVDALASASKQLLISTSSKKGTATQSKKMRAKGWTHELWNVKA